MNVIVCVDDSNGMMFNRRRQSQDRVLRERILSMTKNCRLWMNAYSAKQFKTDEGYGDIVSDEDFLSKAGEGDFCFVEDKYLLPYKDRIEKLFVVRWNRAYPGDMFLDIDVEDGEWVMTDTEEFEGSSHDKITLESWKHIH